MALVLLVLVAWAGVAPAASWPRPSGPVADMAGLMQPQWRQGVTALAQELLQKTGASLVVATIPGLQDQTIEQAAVDIFQQWGIGQKGQDKGVLILVAARERRLRIEVGYGLEGVITDARAGQIRDQYLTPYLRKNQFGPGLLAGAAAVAQLVAQDAGVQLTGLPKQGLSQGMGRGLGIGGVILAIFFFWLVLGGLGGRRRGGPGGLLAGMMLGSMMGNHRGGGGGFDGFGGGFGGFGGGMSGGGGASGGF